MTEDDLQEDQPEETIYFTTYVYLTGLFPAALKISHKAGQACNHEEGHTEKEKTKTLRLTMVQVYGLQNQDVYTPGLIA